MVRRLGVGEWIAGREDAATNALVHRASFHLLLMLGLKHELEAVSQRLDPNA